MPGHPLRAEFEKWFATHVRLSDHMKEDGEAWYIEDKYWKCFLAGVEAATRKALTERNDA